MCLKSYKPSNDPNNLDANQDQPKKTRFGLIIQCCTVLQVPIHVRRVFLRQPLTKKVKFLFNRPSNPNLYMKFNRRVPLIGRLQNLKYIRHLTIFSNPTSIFRFMRFGLGIKYRMKLTTYERICHHFGLNNVKELQSAKSLKRLILYFDKSAYSVSILRALSIKKALLSMKGLEELSIIPQESPLTIKRPFSILPYCKYTMTKLKKITFELPFFQVVTRLLEGLKLFLANHPNIEHVKLNYEGDEISEDDHLLMIQAMGMLTKVKSLQIGYNWCTVTPSQELQNITRTRHFDLKSLHLSIVNTQITSESLSFLVNRFVSRAPPSQFSITILNSPAFRQEQFDIFSKALAGFSELEDLTIRLAPNCEISENQRSAFYNGLDSLKKLTTFTLELKPQLGNMNDYDLEMLGSKLQKLKQLQYLDLSFDTNYDITDQGCQTLFKGISHLTNLQTFIISIEKKSLVTDETTKALRDCLANLAFLKVLSIRIFKCRLTNDCCKELWQGIKGLSSLESLTLKLTNNKLDDAGLGYLRNLLSEQRQLRELSLTVPIFTKDSGIQALVEGISFLKCLKVLKLKIDSVPLTGIGRNGADRIMEAIKGLKRLRELYWELPLSLGMSYEVELYEELKSLEYVSWEEIS